MRQIPLVPLIALASGALLLAAFFLGRAIANRRRKGRLAALDDANTCVACGSHELRWEQDALHCGACGYVGRADRGGALSEEDRRATEVGAVDAEPLWDGVARSAARTVVPVDLNASVKVERNRLPRRRHRRRR